MRFPNFIPPACQTCHKNGTEAKPFDGSCPAAWAHRYLTAPSDHVNVDVSYIAELDALVTGNTTVEGWDGGDVWRVFIRAPLVLRAQAALQALSNTEGAPRDGGV